MLTVNLYGNDERRASPMPFYDSLLSPLKNAWEQIKTEWRESHAEAERENPWKYRIRAEQRQILRDRSIDTQTALQRYKDLNRRQEDLLAQLYPPTND